MNEQIQYASQAPEMIEYIRKVMEWTDMQYENVNMRGLGRAKCCLKLHHSIRTSKMLFEWLNVGKKKERMQQNGICPCCGDGIEDQIHLYHCKNGEMQKAFKEAIATAKSTLVKDGIPSDVYDGFIAMICKAAHHDHPDGTYQRPMEEMQQMMDIQDTLGTQAILRGFHHKKWVTLLHSKWFPSPQGRDGKKQMKKDAMEQVITLITCSWDVFEALWEARNNILHGDENVL